MEKQTKLVNWGNSNAVLIPAEVVEELNLETNQKLLLTIKNKSIILTPINPKPENIHDLFRGGEDDGIRETELDWGESKGNELEW